MNKQDHDALIIFILACVICGLQAMKSCQEEKEKENGQQPTTGTTVLPTFKKEKAEIIRFLGANSAGGNSQHGNVNLRNSERMQR